MASRSAPGGKRHAEIGEERARVLAERIDLDLPAAAGLHETRSEAVTREAADEVGAGDAVVDGDEDGVRHYAASFGTEPGRSESSTGIRRMPPTVSASSTSLAAPTPSASRMTTR